MVPKRCEKLGSYCGDGALILAQTDHLSNEKPFAVGAIPDLSLATPRASPAKVYRSPFVVRTFCLFRLGVALKCRFRFSRLFGAFAKHLFKIGGEVRRLNLRFRSF